MTDSRSISRRDFVVASTVGALALWRAEVMLGEPPAPQTGVALLYVGTYTESGRRDGIYLMRLDARTGALEQVSAVDAGANPSFLAAHPDGRTLYAVNEVTELSGRPTGAVRALRVNAASGALSPLNEQMSEGAAPCYVSTDRMGRVAFVANYVSGTIAVLPIGETGALARASQVVQHVGTGPVTARQQGPHAHYIKPHPSNRFVYAADLGADRIFVYAFNGERMAHMEPSDAVMPPGTGPRHLAFHPALPLVFVVGELNSTVTALRCDPATGALRAVQTLSTIPSTFSGANVPADIHVAPDGRTLYLSNRGHNSIAVFSVAAESGALALQQLIATEGDWPRNFTLDPSGRWLLVANQRSGCIVVFARDAESGRLTRTSRRIDVPSPVCLLFRSVPAS